MRSNFLHRLSTLAIGLGLLAAFAARAQSAAPAAPLSTPPQNVLQLSAGAEITVQQDVLHLTLSTTREGSDAATVQQQLREALDAALKAAGPAEPGQVELRTGSFGVNPRYSYSSKVNKMTGWEGRAELVIEGRDLARITAAAARVETMAISNVSFDLSRQARERAERQAQAEAIERFQAKAKEVAQAFGFAGYTLREVSVGGQDPDFGLAQANRMRVASLKSESVPVEPGQTVVRVTVSGTVQAH